ncbi:MAG: DUF84 family protein [Candidatus Paceibacteria bacterium]
MPHTDNNEAMLVVVASENPVKRNATELAFTSMFPEHIFSFETMKSVSGVSDQPLSDAETLRGVRARVQYVRDRVPHAAFFVGIEGGVEDIDGELHEFAWVVIESTDGTEGKGRSAVFLAPPEIRRLVLEEKKELGEAGDIVFGEENCKQKTGVVGLLTGAVINRMELYRHPAILALIPFIQRDLYSENKGVIQAPEART